MRRAGGTLENLLREITTVIEPVTPVHVNYLHYVVTFWVNALCRMWMITDHAFFAEKRKPACQKVVKIWSNNDVSNSPRLEDMSKSQVGR